MGRDVEGSVRRLTRGSWQNPSSASSAAPAFTTCRASRKFGRRIQESLGQPSAALRIGNIAGLPVVFLSRHDKGHRYSPSDINYRANIDVLKRAGVTDLVSLSACGSFKEELPPGTFVLVDQFVDRTYKRESSFFGRGCVAHVSMAHPVSPRLRIHIANAAMAEEIHIVRDGTYVCIEGPQFSTLAESLTYKNLGYAVIGMTNMPEAKLAREAEICYATVAMVTDFDCWHRTMMRSPCRTSSRCYGQCGQGKASGRTLGKGLSPRARAVSDRVRPRAGQRFDHGAGIARSETAQETRCRGRQGAQGAAPKATRPGKRR